MNIVLQGRSQTTYHINASWIKTLTIGLQKNRDACRKEQSLEIVHVQVGFLKEKKQVNLITKMLS